MLGVRERNKGGVLCSCHEKNDSRFLSIHTPFDQRTINIRHFTLHEPFLHHWSVQKKLIGKRLDQSTDTISNRSVNFKIQTR